MDEAGEDTSVLVKNACKKYSNNLVLHGVNIHVKEGTMLVTGLYSSTINIYFN